MFWKSWQKINEYEQQGIDLVQDFVNKVVGKYGERVHSIFVHGTFARREYVKHSDIDITIIVNTNNDIPIIDAFCNNYKQPVGDACLSAKARSLEELKTGINAVSNKPGPKRLIKLLKTYELVWGKPLSYSELVPENPPIKDLKLLIEFILSQENTKRPMVELAKLYCWVIWFNNEYQRIKRPFSYKAIKEQFPPKSLPYQAVLVWETSGEYIPKDFKTKIFNDLKKRMVELIDEK
jgi:hypothetical protein